MNGEVLVHWRPDIEDQRLACGATIRDVWAHVVLRENVACVTCPACRAWLGDKGVRALAAGVPA